MDWLRARGALVEADAAPADGGARPAGSRDYADIFQPKPTGEAVPANVHSEPAPSAPDYAKASRTVRPRPDPRPLDDRDD